MNSRSFSELTIPQTTESRMLRCISKCHPCWSGAPWSTRECLTAISSRETDFPLQ
jgi:hypothetical protein